jgi:hypothetical protein
LKALAVQLRLLKKEHMINADASELNEALPLHQVSTEEEGPAHSSDDKILLNEIERILHSEELRGSEVSRRLLKYLAEKSVTGEADELKEYIVAIDGLGKPASYDPRHNSAVRIQVGRLRQKLAEYYRREGLEDPIVIDIPKGRFRLKYEYREGCPPSPEHRATQIPQRAGHDESLRKITLREALVKYRMPVVICAGAILALAAGAAYNAYRPSKANATAVTYSRNWNADLEDLWRPFIATNRPMIVAIEDPLFVELDGKKGVYYRDKTLNSWQDVVASPAVEAMRSALKNREIAPSRYYTAFGEVDSSFLLARMLGSRVQNLSVVKTSDLSMRALVDNNVVFVGIENIFFTDQIQAAPVEVPLQPFHDGIRNVHPGPGEPAMFIDEFRTAPTEEGVAYALVTHVPGPLGDNHVESFTCNRSAGYVAAVKAFTDPNFVRSLVGELKKASGGQMPHYYQVLLKVKFTAEVPTEITYVLAREIHYPGRS